MSVRGGIVACLCLVASASPARVEPQTWLDGAEITAAFSGKKIKGEYANGLVFYETYGPDGRVDYAEKHRASSGRWSITAGTLCTIYGNDPSGGCFRVARVGRNCFEFYFVSRTEALAPGGGEPAWTARGGVVGQIASCADSDTV